MAQFYLAWYTSLNCYMFAAVNIPFPWLWQLLVPMPITYQDYGGLSVTWALLVISSLQWFPTNQIFYQISLWRLQIFAVLEQTPRVRFLNLSFNRLSAQIQAAQALQPRWDSLSHLVLNSTYVGWPNVHALLKALPALEEFHLSLNEYSYVDLSGQDVNEKDKCEACSRLNIADLPEPVHESLKKLHFSGNPVSSWKEISKLGYAFPNLETLLVNDCHIITLEPDPCEKCGDNNGNKKSHDAFKWVTVLGST